MKALILGHRQKDECDFQIRCSRFALKRTHESRYAVEYLVEVYATSRKVAGSILDEVIAFFNRPNSSGRTVALWSTQPLTEIKIGNLPGG
jgi:hypothetical protein